MGSYSAVASVPASWRMALGPPGCSGRKRVTSYTLPYRITQQLSAVLCFATVGCQDEVLVAVCHSYTWRFFRCSSAVLNGSWRKRRRTLGVVV
jgi:hypothetical protein